VGVHGHPVNPLWIRPWADITITIFAFRVLH